MKDRQADRQTGWLMKYQIQYEYLTIQGKRPGFQVHEKTRTKSLETTKSSQDGTGKMGQHLIQSVQ